MPIRQAADIDNTNSDDTNHAKPGKPAETSSPKGVVQAIVSLPKFLSRPPTAIPYIAQIDGLRCLAIMIVLIWHVSLRAARNVDILNGKGEAIANLYAFFPHGEVGVALFFFISGYIIAKPFLTRPIGQWRIGRFYSHRFRRIYPPYVIAATICLLIVMMTGYSGQETGKPNLSAFHSWLASLFYLHGLLYDMSSRLDPPLWSLEIEIQFYALAPLLLALYLRPARRLAVGCVLVALLILMAGLLDLWQPFDPRFRFGLPAHAYLFLTGIVVADITRMTPGGARAPSRAYDLAFIGGLAVLGLEGLYLTQVNARPGGAWPDIGSDLAIVLSVLALYAGAMHGRLASRIMGTPWITTIGTMCFSIYLTHVVVIEALAKLLKHLPLHAPLLIWGVYLLVLIPAAIMVGGVFYVVIERPFMSSFPARAVLASGFGLRKRAVARRRA